MPEKQNHQAYLLKLYCFLLHGIPLEIRANDWVSDISYVGMLWWLEITVHVQLFVRGCLSLSSSQRHNHSVSWRPSKLPKLQNSTELFIYISERCRMAKWKIIKLLKTSCSTDKLKHTTQRDGSHLKTVHDHMY